MTFVNKKTRAFMDRGDIKPEQRRSEARLKTYPSAIDIRAWCDIVEDRRQHILELVTKGKARCFGKLIPLEAIINCLVGDTIADLKKLRQCLAQLMKFIEGANLSSDDKQRFISLKKTMHPICVDGDGKGKKGKTDEECPATGRHERELAEVNAILKPLGSYKVKTTGPARVITRIKGFRPPGSVSVSWGPSQQAGGPGAPGPQTASSEAGGTSGQDQKALSGQMAPGVGTDQGQESGAAETISGQISEGGIPLSTSGTAIQDLTDATSAQGSKISSARPSGIVDMSVEGGSARPSGIVDMSAEGGSARPSGIVDMSTGGIAGSARPSEMSAMSKGTGLQDEEKYDAESAISEKPGDKQSELGTMDEKPSTGRPPCKDTCKSRPSEIQNVQKELYEEGDEHQIKDEKKSPRKSGEFKSTDAPVLDFNLPPEEFRAQAENMQNFCRELQEQLQTSQNEREKCKSQLDSTLDELNSLKKAGMLGIDLSSSLCKDEIETFETKMKQMRTENLTPEQEADVIKREVESLKKYCMKLKTIEDENEKLRSSLKGQGKLSEDTDKDAKNMLNIADKTLDVVASEKDMLINKVKELEKQLAKYNNLPDDIIKELTGDGTDGQLKDMIKTLEETIKERDMLANKVQQLEKELQQYRNSPEDMDVYRNRSKMLDNALEERDRMSKKVDQIKGIEDELNQLRKKSLRADELEEELKSYNRNDKNIASELKKMTSKCNCLEKELLNAKMEKDSMCARVEYMKKEIEMLRAKCKEAEVYKLERDKLQMRLNELSPLQDQYENLRLKCKCLQNAAAEKEVYKQKYEEAMNSEGQGALRSQIEAAKNLERERNSLVKQVGDLESCICDQEEEIKKLVMQIDNLCRTKDSNQCRVKEALCCMRAEIEKKDTIIAESEKKLATVQAHLKSSIQGVSCETICLRTRIEDLERELQQCQLQNEALKKQLDKNSGSFRQIDKLTKCECHAIQKMKCELKFAKAENKKLREIAGKMVALTGDEHTRNKLMAPNCAAKRVVEEISRQYKQIDNMRRSQEKVEGVDTCPCKGTNVDSNQLSGSESEKIPELEDIKREKQKLEQIVKEIQSDKSPDQQQQDLISLRMAYANVKEQLEKEVKLRKDLEKQLQSR